MKLFGNQSSASSSSEDDQIAFDDVHTSLNPYCGNLSCWCHTNVSYHDDVQHPDRNPTQEEVNQAFSFFGLGRHGGR
jgi:hypothetical protein